MPVDVEVDQICIMAQRQRRRLLALRNDPNLRPYVQEGTDTGEQLGTGSYGSVVEVRQEIICSYMIAT